MTTTVPWAVHRPVPADWCTTDTYAPPRLDLTGLEPGNLVTAQRSNGAQAYLVLALRVEMPPPAVLWNLRLQVVRLRPAQATTLTLELRRARGHDSDHDPRRRSVPVEHGHGVAQAIINGCAYEVATVTGNYLAGVTGDDAAVDMTVTLRRRPDADPSGWVR